MRESAGGRDVRISGGAEVIQQYLNMGVVDELEIALTSVLFGSGVCVTCARKDTYRMKTFPFGLVAFLSLSVTAYAVITYALMPLGAVVHPDMRVNFEAHRIGIYAHISASAVALALGPLQFVSALRARRPSLHRFCGRLYLGVGVLLGGVAGLYMAFHALAARSHEPASGVWPSPGSTRACAPIGQYALAMWPGIADGWPAIFRLLSPP